jgi:hypothetical protein
MDMYHYILVGLAVANKGLGAPRGPKSKSFWAPLKKSTVLTFTDMKKTLTNDKERKVN